VRRLRIAAPAQLSMSLPAGEHEPLCEELWASLPDEAQARLLSLFARLIARGVVVEEEEQTR
jgi:hypothetical protein